MKTRPFTTPILPGSRLMRLIAIATGLALVSTALPAVTAPVFALSCTITGTADNDVLRGTSGDDVICGGNGSDTIDGGGGNDTLYGGGGSDVLSGGDGDDVLFGENEQDTLFGQAGNDTLSGGNSADKLDGGEGDDTVDGGNDADTLQGGAGNDVVNGKLGDDVLDGGPGTDQLIGENGADSMYGGFGNDSLLGGLGNDTLYGGPGNDKLNGDKGKNTCDGGTGINAFAGCSTTVNPGGPDPAGDWADTDADGVVDAIEIRAGTDLLKADTDADGLADGAELQSITDPTKTDTDGNGISDAADDPDADGLTTADELGRGTKAGEPDTDGDSLTDGQEVALGSNPLAVDTDLDGLTDSEEVALGSNPTVVDSDENGIADGDDSFAKQVFAAESAATYEARGLGKAVLSVSLSVSDDERLNEVPGQRAPPIEIKAPLALEPGTLTIPFDPADLGPGANLAVLRFNNDTQTFEFPADQAVDLERGIATVQTPDGGIISAQRSAQTRPADWAELDSGAGNPEGEAISGSRFSQTLATAAPATPTSQFVIVDVDEFDAIWASEIATPRGGNASGNIDVVLTLDSSGSMSWNDPGGARKTASKSFVDSLRTGDQAAVVDFDYSASVYQSMTTDFDAVKSAIDRVDDSGGTNLSAGMDAALNELDTNGDSTHQRVIVFLTDGDGYYDESSTTRAAASDTTVYTVGLGYGTNTALLSSIAASTGGKFYYVPDASGLTDVFEGIGSDTGEPDADADGLADTAETSGWRDGSGRVFHTDPNDADTDNDGLSDGEEAGQLTTGGAFGRGTYYGAFSDPTRADTDSDTLSDLYEQAEGLSAWKADLDNDGLNDAQETQTHSTEAFSDDTDVDGYTDTWEIDHASEGFDPLILDYQTSVFEYIGEFSRGALCGDITNVGPFCEGQSLAYLAGNISSGVVFIGDIRDAIAGVVNLDFISTAFSVAALIPIGGDIAAGIKKTEKFIKAADEIPSGAALRSTMKDFGKSTADKMDLLRKVSPTAVTKLTTAGLPDADIVRLASRMISAKHFDDMVKAANDIKKAPNTYRLEKDAETFLRANTPGALPTQIRSQTVTGDTRYYDVLDPRSRRAIEIKHGRARDVGRAASQAERDFAITNDPSSQILSVEWHFFTGKNNTVGPDVALLERLARLGIPFTLWVA